MSIKTMLQKWLGITPEVKYVEVREPKFVLNGGRPVNFFPQLPSANAAVGFSYGKHYAKSYVQMYAAHPFEAWDRILQIRGALAIHHKTTKNEYELRITDYDHSRYGFNKKCVSKTFTSIDKCKAFKQGLIGKHNNERALRGLKPLDSTLFKSKYD